MKRGLLISILVLVLLFGCTQKYTQTSQEETNNNETAIEDLPEQISQEQEEVEFTLSDKELIFTGGYADPSVIQMPGGNYLMYLNRFGEQFGPQGTGVFISSSQDGFSWKEETETIFPGVAVGRAVKFPEGIRYYYHKHKRQPSYPFEPVPTNIVSSFSSNGITNWEYEGIAVEPREGYGIAGPTIISLKNNTYRMFFYEAKLNEPGQGQIMEGIIYGATSNDGLNWRRDEEPTIVYDEEVEGEKLNFQRSQVLHPFVIIWPEKEGYLMLYNSHSRIFAAFSKEGFKWEKLGNTEIYGADSDAIHLSDGSFRIYWGGGCIDVSEVGCKIDQETGRIHPGTVHTGILRIKYESKEQNESGEESNFEVPEVEVSTSYENPHPKVRQQIPQCCNHPYYHKVYRAFSNDGLNWEKENILIKDHASVPAILQKDDGSFILYYVDGEVDTMDCSVSEDGLNFRPGNCTIYNFTANKAWDPHVDKLENGKYRMYFFAPGSGGPTPNHKIMSAISDDGITWFQEEGIRFEDEGVLDPAVIKIDSEWKMYTGDMEHGSIVLAKSNDGLNFVKETEFNVGGNVPEIVKLDSGQYALYFCKMGIEVVTSTNGAFSWSSSSVAMEPTRGEVVCDPSIIKTKDGKWVMYYKVQGPPTR